MVSVESSWQAKCPLTGRDVEIHELAFVENDGCTCALDYISREFTCSCQEGCEFRNRWECLMRATL